MDRSGVQRWIDRYVQAWRTNDPAAVGELFSEDARYLTTPYRPPKEGRDAIVAWWRDVDDTPGSWDCRYVAQSFGDGVGFVTGWTSYATGERYHNAYLIRFDPSGQATEFIEWWMLEPAEGEPSEGEPAEGEPSEGEQG